MEGQGDRGVPALRQQEEGLRPLLVGESNPYGADPAFALYPEPERASGGRLCRILGMYHRDYLDSFDRVNLATGRWDLRLARLTVLGLVRERPARSFILLGSRVARAFDVKFEPFEAARVQFSETRPSKNWGFDPADRARRGLDSAGPHESTLTVNHVVDVLVLPHPSGLNRMWNDKHVILRAREAVAAFLPHLAELFGRYPS